MKFLFNRRYQTKCDHAIKIYKVVAIDISDNPSVASTEVSAKTLKIIAQIRAQYYCGGTDSSAVDLRPRIQLVNDGPMNVILTDISVRYWFTSEPGLATLSNTIDYAAVGNSAVTSNFANGGDFQYLELGFTSSANAPTWLGGDGTANSFPIDAKTGDIHSRILTSSSTIFNQVNDYSFDSSITSYSDNSKVTVYYKKRGFLTMYEYSRH